MIEYFCYVSEAKVDNLLAQIDQKIVSSRTEEELIEKHKSVNPSIGKLLSLFSLGAKFGKTDRIVISEVQHVTVIQKLRRVLTYLVEEEGIHDLFNTVEQRGSLESLYYSYTGHFRVSRFDDEFAHLHSRLSEKYSLEFVCSMKYFSDMGKKGEIHIPHSGNHAFFSGRIEPTFRSVLIAQDIVENLIVGTPLCLALQPIGGLNL